MIQQPTLSEEKEETLQQINYVKSLVDELYQKEVFYSFSLHTLELGRRFNSTFQKYQQEPRPEVFQELRVLAHNLEVRLQEFEG